MSALRQRLREFRRAWDVSLKMGAVEAIVRDLYPPLHEEHERIWRQTAGRPTGARATPWNELWPCRVMRPETLRLLLFDVPFDEAVRQIVRDDAPWWVWSNPVSLDSYIRDDLPRAWDRTWNRLRAEMVRLVRAA